MVDITFKHRKNIKTGMHLIIVNDKLIGQADTKKSAKLLMSYAIKVCGAVEVIPPKAVLHLILDNESEEEC